MERQLQLILPLRNNSMAAVDHCWHFRRHLLKSAGICPGSSPVVAGKCRCLLSRLMPEINVTIPGSILSSLITESRTISPALIEIYHFSKICLELLVYWSCYVRLSRRKHFMCQLIQPFNICQQMPCLFMRHIGHTVAVQIMSPDLPILLTRNELMTIAVVSI